MYDQDITITWKTVNGSATSAGDFTATTGGSLVITAGNLSGTISVPINNDSDDETFSVHLGTPTNATIGDGSGVCTIYDNDTPSGSMPTVSISLAGFPANGLVYESEGAPFTITLSHAINKTVRVHYATTTSGTAIAGTRYTAISRDLYFAPNQTSQQIGVELIDDQMYEGGTSAPYFFVTLSSPLNATIGTSSGYAIIIDDDPIPTLSINDVTVTEGDPGGAAVNATFTLSLTNPINVPIAVTPSIGPATALFSSDYSGPTTINVTIPSGQTFAQFSVPITADLVPEQQEFFYATITSAGVYTTDYQGTCQIVDNDRTVTVDIDTDSNNSGLITDVDDPIEMDNPARMIVLRDSDNANTPVAQKDLALVRLSVATAGFTQAELNNSTLVLAFDSGGDRIRIWQDALGNTPLLMNHQWAYTAFPGTIDVWVEGLQIGSSVLSWTMNVNGLAVAQPDLIRLNVVQGDLVGHRSRMGSGREGTQYHAIAYATETLALPMDQEESLGVGLRRNFDDDDVDGTIDTWQTTVAFEDDTAELTSTSEIPLGAELVLRASNDSIAIWDGSEKTNILVGLDPTTGVMHNEYVVPLPFLNHSYFVEWVNNTPGAGAAATELYARDPRSGGSRLLDRVTYYPYNSVVVVLSGEDLSGSSPASGSGLFSLAEALYLEGYNSYFFDENEVTNTGAGLVYDQVRHQLRDHSVAEVSIFGHSHGGGSTHDLADYLSVNQSALPSFSVPFTAYVDAIRNTSNTETAAEDRRPPLSQFHSNFWQWYAYPSPLALHGASVSSAEDDINVNWQWGTSDTHTTMDNNIQVISAIRGRVETKVVR